MHGSLTRAKPLRGGAGPIKRVRLIVRRGAVISAAGLVFTVMRKASGLAPGGENAWVPDRGCCRKDAGSADLSLHAPSLSLLFLSASRLSGGPDRGQCTRWRVLSMEDARYLRLVQGALRSSRPSPSPMRGEAKASGMTLVSRLVATAGRRRQRVDRKLAGALEGRPEGMILAAVNG
jgi:hypothetical protein